MRVRKDYSNEKKRECRLGEYYLLSLLHRGLVKQRSSALCFEEQQSLLAESLAEISVLSRVTKVLSKAIGSHL